VKSKAREPVISVMLAVPDVPLAVEWYMRALGAAELWSLGSVAGMEVEGAPFFLAQPEKKDWGSPTQVGATTVRVELFCDDPDAVVRRALEAGATGRSGVRDHQMPWGPHRQGGFVDPFGHIWFVGDRSPLRPFPDDGTLRHRSETSQPHTKRVESPQTVTPQFRITDARRSISFYVRGLGFKIDWEHRFEPGFPVFMQLTRAGQSIFLTEHAGDCQVGGAAYFLVPDVDACYEEFGARGVVPTEPPADMPWGPREMVVADPDGNRLRFASPGTPAAAPNQPYLDSSRKASS